MTQPMDGVGMGIIAASLGLLGKPEPPKSHRVVMTVDTYLRLTPATTRYGGESEERFGKRLEQEAREIEEFIRDHRSQDRTSVYVHFERQAVCSECQRPWESMTEDGVTYCANCGLEVDK